MVLFTDGGCTNSNQKNPSLRKMVMVVADEHGQVVVERNEAGGSNNIAELLAIKYAVLYAKNKNAENLLIKSDSKIAIGWIHSDGFGKHLNNRELTQEIKTEILLLMKERLVSFVWIPREENLAGQYIEEVYCS